MIRRTLFGAVFVLGATVGAFALVAWTCWDTWRRLDTSA